ncbi:MAG: metallophosphoesterase [Dongiaceae bacterium]
MNRTTAADRPAKTRVEWAARRAAMEARDEKLTPAGARRRRWPIFKLVARALKLGLRLSGLYALGRRNAYDIHLNALVLRVPRLPVPFDGFRILQISDPHFDGMPGLDDVAADLIRDLSVDLMAWTGDYRLRVHGGFDHVLPSITKVARAARASEGIVATLGNHDPADMVAPLEAHGIRVLINETMTIRRAGEAIHVTGLDDVHYFYTAQARNALAAAPAGFRIALVHSPEAALLAAEAGFALYLCGHTHGGQICLPGGVAIITNNQFRWRFVAGVWRCGQMTGYTNRGLGTSGLPVRFFCRGEAALITLRRAESG